MGDSLIQGRVGPVAGADGSFQYERLTTLSAQVVAQAHGKYAEAVARGNCYGGITASTGVSIASLALGTTGPITLHNPIGSNKRFVLMTAAMGYVSGTAGAGNLVYAVSPGITATNPTGTAITPVNLLVGAGNNSVAKLLTTSTITAPTAVRNFCNLDAFVGSLTTNPFNVLDDLDGSIQLLPGTGVTITGTTAAGTSPLVVFSLQWEEVPLVGGV